MARQRSVFDIVGPVMVGPSSSHTAGAVRLGLLARAVFGSTPTCARIGLHGSFASTGRGHGTDLALTAGLLGFPPDDLSIRDAEHLAADAGLEISFDVVDLGQVHPNTASFELSGPDARATHLQGSSLGGGDVMITHIDSYDVEVTGELPLLLVAHLDRPGEIAAVTAVLAEEGVNVASMQVSRERRGAGALMLIETDVPVGTAALDRISSASGITGVRVVPAV
ncbi:MAG: L-serine ammonia-lyase, iron-sulfur-dependent subunit beta [Anaerosomatales bacterium]|nr:L-serine ammonia-lyase, iron-sulfur-dependent subunit beta [Anaerosomatales bacterium]MDT8433743.1 L-serine ammonia-lyase, iron-sulfur-dependent subunit beta [Anaerosomatales bacterium]